MCFDIWEEKFDMIAVKVNYQLQMETNLIAKRNTHCFDCWQIKFSIRIDDDQRRNMKTRKKEAEN
jgi:hypothetical protein